MPSHFTLIDKASELTPEALLFLKTTDQAYFPTPWDDDSWSNLFLEGADRFVLVADKGFALFDVSIADSFAHLLKIVLNPEVRGKGLGKELLNESLNQLKKRSIHSFFLEVEEGNLSAIKLYESVGFQVIHKKKHFYSNGATALIMTLDV